MRKPHSSFKLQEAACVVNSRELRAKWTVSDYRRVYQGLVWLRIESNNFSTTIPLQVTSGFNDKSCHDRSVGRIFTVDVQPPKVEPRLY